MKLRLMDAIPHPEIRGPDTMNVTFETTPDPICGIELRTPGYKLAWNLADYLEKLDENLARAMENGNS
ncbi:MAG: hypothetical protein F6K19_47355 [Cyanothece sp. SIO1E1]|nr:hypothetical protein [Cyanothece sp. SIO1E1]